MTSAVAPYSGATPRSTRTRLLPPVSGPASVEMDRRAFLKAVCAHALSMKRTSAFAAALGVATSLSAVVMLNESYSYWDRETDIDVSKRGDEQEAVRRLEGSTRLLMCAVVLLMAWLTNLSITTWMRATARCICPDGEVPAEQMRWHLSTFAAALLASVGAYYVPSRMFGILNLYAVYSIGAAVMAARALGTHSAWEQLGRVMAGGLLTVGVLTAVYARVVPPLLLDPSVTDGQRLVLRLVLQPVMQELAALLTRFFGRHVPGGGSACSTATRLLGVIPYGLSNLYGRYVVSTLEHFSSLLICVVIMAVEETLLRASVLRRDEWLMRPFLGRKAAREYARSQRSARVKADLLIVDELTEDAGIWVSTSWKVFMRQSVAGQLQPVSTMLLGGAVQYAMESATDLVPGLFAYFFAPDEQTVLPLEDSAEGFNLGALPLDQQLGLRVKRHVCNTINSWHSRDRSHTLMLALSIAGWALYTTRSTFQPITFWCAVSSEEVMGLEWWRQTPC